MILGAGPAGCASAVQLCRAGYRVTLIDRQSFPRHAPGETLHPGIEPLLSSLGLPISDLDHCAVKHRGVFNIDQKKSVYTPYHETEPWQGLHICREDLDQHLLTLAQNDGATFIPQSAAEKIRIDGSGVITEVVTSTTTIKPRYVIDASGRRGWLARQLNIEYQYYSPRLIAYYGHVESHEDKFREPALFWDEKGWTWLALVKPNRLSWVRLDIRSEQSDSSLVLPPITRTVKRSQRKAADVSWRIAKKTSDKNYFLTGDAAFVLDPTSSHGIIKAIMSGLFVGRIIESTERHDLSTLHQGYCQWLSQWFEQDRRTLIQQYRDHCFDLGEHSQFTQFLTPKSENNLL